MGHALSGHDSERVRSPLLRILIGLGTTQLVLFRSVSFLSRTER